MKQQRSIISFPLVCYTHHKYRSRIFVMPKRKAYTVCKKLDLVIRLRKSESQCKVSREMRVPESTLRGWLKDEVKLREFLINVCTASVNSYACVPLLISRLLFSMSITHSDASYSQPIVTGYCRFVFHNSTHM